MHSDNHHIRGCSSGIRSEEHTSELQSPDHLVCRLLLEKKKNAWPARRQARPRRQRRVRRASRALQHAQPGALPVRGAALFFFFNDTATTEIYTLSLHDALPISKPLFSIASLPPRAPDFAAWS